MISEVLSEGIRENGTRSQKQFRALRLKLEQAGRQSHLAFIYSFNALKKRRQNEDLIAFENREKRQALHVAGSITDAQNH
jgi:hypothetical protein